MNGLDQNTVIVAATPATNDRAPATRWVFQIYCFSVRQLPLFLQPRKPKPREAKGPAQVPWPGTQTQVSLPSRLEDNARKGDSFGSDTAVGIT